METCKIILFKIYNFTTSSFLKAPSNSSNFSSKLRSISTKSTKLDRDLQPILESLGQFLLIKINLSKFFYCKRHLLRLVRIPTNENIFSNSIWYPTIPKIFFSTKTNVENMLSCFSHHYN